MSCYCPSYVWRKVNKITGEIETKWIGRLDKSEEAELLARDYGGNKSDTCQVAGNLVYRHDMIQVPCGKCIGCRIDYSRSWADRMTYHAIGKDDHSWFITLTYSDEYLDKLVMSENYGIASLDYSHMDDFVKGLRNKFRDAQLDYYYSGEYGDASFRAHFHMILYNADISDLVFFKLNDNGDPIYTSDTLSQLWKDRGFVTVSRFSWRGAAYTASYVEKKRDGRKLCEYTAVGIEPEKARMSRRPGLAYDYYLENAGALWKNYGLAVDRSVNSSGHLGMPRYFRKLAEEKGIGLDAYLEAKERSLDRANILNPLKVDNSSFDLLNVSKMLEFEQREFLSRKENKKL